MSVYIIGVVAAVGIVIMAKRKASGSAVSGGETLPGGGGKPWTAEPSADIRNTIVSVARAYGIPPAFAMANAAHESRFNPRVGLNTLDGENVPEGAIPERSIGLMGINVNPNTPTGRRRIGQIKQLRGVNTDHGVVEALRDPNFNVSFWANYIALPSIQEVINSGATGRRKWLKVRLKFYGGNLNLDGNNKWAKITRTDFPKTLDRWEQSYGVAE